MKSQRTVGCSLRASVLFAACAPAALVANAISTVELEPVDPLTVNVVVTTETGLRGGELALGIFGSAATFSDLKPGPDFPPGNVSQFYVAGTPTVNCQGDAPAKALTVGWVHPTNDSDEDPSLRGPIVLPAGRYRILTLSLKPAVGSSDGECYGIRFLDCLGPQEAP